MLGQSPELALHRTCLGLLCSDKATFGCTHTHSRRNMWLCTPPQSPHLFAHYGVRPPRGLLLFGPPGTGKSTMARAAAAAAGAALLVVNGPDVISEFLGDSEAGLRGELPYS